MIRIKTDKKFKLVAFFMSFIILLACVMPIAMSGKAGDGDTITIYFDTGGGMPNDNGNNYGWQQLNGDNPVVYYVINDKEDTNDGGNTKLTFPADQTLTLVSGMKSKKDPTNGKILKATISSSNIGKKISFSAYNSSGGHMQGDYYRTACLNSVTVQDNRCFHLNGHEQRSYWEAWYYDIPKETVVNYAGDKFKIANLTSDSVGFTFEYASKDGTNVKTITSKDNSSQVVAARTLGTEFVIPDVESGKMPYASIKIIRESDSQLIKNYTFSQDPNNEKIRGQTLKYGLTEYEEVTNLVDDADKKTLSFRGDDYKSYPAVTKKLYLAKKGFKDTEGNADMHQYAGASAITVRIYDDSSPNGYTDYDVEDVNTGGNASYVTKTAITVGENKVFSILCKYVSGGKTYTDKYNLVWDDSAKDLCVISGFNKAEVTAEYSVQGTDNELNGQKYMTVKADFFDYQYDHNGANDSSFTYKEYQLGTKSMGDGNTEKKYFSYNDSIIFTNSLNWSNVYAYFFDGYNENWPGNRMNYIGNNTNNESQYIIKVPSGAQKVIFNDGNGTQTVNITIEANKGYYAINETENSKYKTGTWNLSGTASNKANSKRPYLVINEALSASNYGSTSLPMYLGQFWLPFSYSDKAFSNTSDAYNDTTAGKQRAANNSIYQTNDRYFVANAQSADNKYTHSGFGDVLTNFKWGANLAFRTDNQSSGTHRPFDAVAQGLVGGFLRGSNATTFVRDGKLLAPNSKIAVPYFDDSDDGFWTGTFTTSQGDIVQLSDYLKKYKNLDFPFFEINDDNISFSNGLQHKVTINGTEYTKLLSNPGDHYKGKYYLFDSQKYSVKVKEEDGKYSLEKHNEWALPEGNKNRSEKYMVYDNYGSDGDASATPKGQQYGLFPFNSRSEGGYNSDALHYGYGIRYDIDFYMTETGTVDGSADGTAITFTFQGDDDVWVYLDGKLLLDMGGAHKNAAGEINFKTKQTWISAIGSANTNDILSNNIGSDDTDDDNVKRQRSSVTKFFNSSDWTSRLKEGEHTITMFYMERGMLNSNLYCMFNLPTNVTKLQIQEDTDFGKVNSAFENAVKYVADGDVFNYSLENKGTSTILGSEYKAPTGSAVTRSNSESGNTAKATTLDVSSSEQKHTYNFNNSGTSENGYMPVESTSGGVTYEIKDFMTGATISPVTYDTRRYNSTGKSNIVSLQYGELASLSKQFSANSGMRVTQLDTLSAPSGTSRAAGYNDNTNRSVSKYYTTYVKAATNSDGLSMLPSAGLYRGLDVSGYTLNHVQDMYEDNSGGSYTLKTELIGKNYSNNSVVNLQRDKSSQDVVTTYTFNDPEYPTNTNVFLRQVFVNTVNTADLKFTKVMSDDNSPAALENSFTFTIKFTKVFGSGDSTALSKININSLKYYLDGNTTAQSFSDYDDDNKTVTFSIKPNHYITIKDIPVGTEYIIDENDDAKYTLDADRTQNLRIENGTVVATEITGDDELEDIVWFNKSKTGAIRLRKVLQNENGNINTTSTQKFQFTIKCEKTGAALSAFPIKYHLSGSPTESTNLTWIREEKTVSGNTTYEYSINVEVPVDDNSGHNKDIIIEGIPLGTTYTVTETVPPSYTQVGDVAYTRGTDDTDVCKVEKPYTTASTENDGKIDLITINNKFVPIIMPSTGGTPFILLFPFGIIAIVISAGALVIYKRRLQYKTVIK